MATKRRRASRGSGEQLREDIIVAATKLLAETGHADDVSVRAVADAVGVTSPSIYLHFADKAELLNAVAADVFRGLDEAMIEAAAPETTPLGRLRAQGLAYVAFAVAHPEQYRLATMEPCAEPNREVDEVLQSSAFSHFSETVVECITAGIFAGPDPLPITFALWAAAHGVASLMIAKPYLPWGPVEEFADRVLGAAAAGHAVTGRLPDPLTPAGLTAWVANQDRLPPTPPDTSG